MLFLMLGCTRPVLTTCVSVSVCAQWGNELRDALPEQGENGDSILNGDECVLRG